MMSYFGLREWQFQNTNIDQLATLLKTPKYFSHKSNGYINSIHNPDSNNNNSNNNNNCNIMDKNYYCVNGYKMKPNAQRADLEFDLKTIDWDAYFFNYLPGIKKYFFKEHLNDNGKTVAHYNR